MIVYQQNEVEQALFEVESRLNDKIIETGFDVKYFDGLQEAIRIVREIANDRKTD